MRIESIPESRWGERRNRRCMHLQQEALAGARTASMVQAEWMWEKALENVSSAGFQKRKILYLFFSECSNSGRLWLSGPLKFRKEKRKKKIASFKEEKDNKHTHSWENKIHPQKTSLKIYLSFKKQKRIGMWMGTGHGMTIRCGIPTGSQAYVC